MKPSESSSPPNMSSKDSERVEKLNSIGFAWKGKDPRQVPWEQRFNELMEFKQEHGKFY
jgi:hypothetical protein